MKNTLKLIAVFSVFALIIGVFCACDINFGKEETTNAPTVITAEDITQTKPDPTRPSELSSEESTEKIEIDSLDTILNNIIDYPMGTAGSSTKAYQIAYKLLNYTENSNFTISEVQQDYQNFINSLSDTQRLVYEENLAEIDYYARDVIKNPSVLSQHLENFKPISESGEITLSNYEALYVIISK